ncbi:16S rRNA (guanine(527)-N(7))-methyltransferase RsmG [Leptolyngbya sp. 'hensonii']|uniref:16S rRNA (guanine(527)-N(7))-methyltransferase RsmG n=1 Tax=Leptolyngbya sp. 'hensonii' TaxID=1922337 RepID=UPI0009502F5C|nr:16S rRNA (guanine(527)-N(7))-methyltransferase RsmG [Leptolyngbya sp. 'hensonii']OLP20212.1 16S rRNA (guanine(527)-N(7))-methyltransferase RsmG [Leptolyngbya sp. 'hensonii']
MPVSLPNLTTIWQETIGWQPDSDQVQQFQQLYDLLLEGNQSLNLTRITEPEEFWEKHLWDSLVGVRRFLSSSLPPQKVIDIGTGGGFPGLPVAIACPTWSVTLVDGTRKKIDFLKALIARMELKTVQTLHDRAEILNRRSPYQSSYDLALIRAVGSAIACAEYALPFLRTGGVAVLYRGQWTDGEAVTLAPVLEQQQATLEEIDALTTPLSRGIRHCLYLKKL